MANCCLLIDVPKHHSSWVGKKTQYDQNKFKKTLRDGLHSSENPIKGAKEKRSKMENDSKIELQNVQDAG